VAELLDTYPELEDVLIDMAPPFKKLRNPILRKSVAKVSTLQQAAIVGRLDVSFVIDQLRRAVGQGPAEAMNTPSEEDYLGAPPDWFDASLVFLTIDDRTGEVNEMAITRISKALIDLPERQAIELTTTFLPAPGIDVARNRGFRTWTVREGDLYRTYFSHAD
jgi:hypothetical protein